MKTSRRKKKDLELLGSITIVVAFMGLLMLFTGESFGFPIFITCIIASGIIGIRVHQIDD